MGRTLLLAPDVPGDFLGHRITSMLKALVGGDSLTAEAKGSNAVFTLTGNLNVLITSNSRLRVRLDGDAGPWRRRLIIIRFDKSPPTHRIDNLADKLIAEEGPGILRWAVAGYVSAREEMARTGDLVLTSEQRARVEALLSQSDSLRWFVRECTQRGQGDVAAAELTEGYVHFCSDREWTPLPARKVEGGLRDTILETFGITQSHGVKREGHSQRGWCGIRLRHEATEGAPTAEFDYESHEND